MQCLYCGTINPAGSTKCERCGSPLGGISPEKGAAPSGLELAIGTELKGGVYRVGKVLGQGGFGITYMGANTRTQTPVAIKEFFLQGCSRKQKTVASPKAMSKESFEESKLQFVQEAQRIAQFDHPGIMKVYEIFEENNTAYMIAEFLKGKSLLKVLEERDGVMKEDEAIYYIRKIADALEVVHQSGLLHRDVKPENIIVCDDSRVVLLDFGAAREYVANKTSNMTTILTPGYAPLEQYGTQARYGAYTDIYALGATLYHLITGRVPVAATDRIQSIELKPPHEINNKISRWLSNAVMRAMAIKVEERPSSIKEFLDAIQIQDEPERKIKSTTPRKTVWRNALLGAFAMVIIIIAIFFYFAHRSLLYKNLLGHSRSVLSVNFCPDGITLASGSSDDSIIFWNWQNGLAIQKLEAQMMDINSLAFSPDGNMLIFGGSNNYIKAIEWKTKKMLYAFLAHAADVDSIAISPSGEYLASASWDKTVKIWNANTGKLINILKGHTDLVRTVAFSPDSKFLASGSSDMSIKIWNLENAKAVRTLAGHQSTIKSLAFSPDGKVLASGSYDKTIKIWDWHSGTYVITLAGHTDQINSVAFSPKGKLLASGSTDSTIIIWDWQSERIVKIIKGHSAPVNTVAFSPDGNYLASGSDDATIKIWNMTRILL